MKADSLAAAGPAASAVPPREVQMPVTFSIERAPKNLGRPQQSVVIRWDGEADLKFDGWWLFKVKTEPARNPRQVDRINVRRWKEYTLYTNRDPGFLLKEGVQGRGDTRLIVAEEGHSDGANERTKYQVAVCK